MDTTASEDTDLQDIQQVIFQWALKQAAVVFAENAQLLAAELDSSDRIVLTGPEALRLFATMARSSEGDMRNSNWGVAGADTAHLLSMLRSNSD